jgi:hypothetical protein
VSIGDALQNLWTGLLDLLSKVVIPDWNSLVALLPVFLVIGVIGPIATILVLGWVVYQLTRPRTKVRFAEGPVAAPIGDDGKPIFPTAEPFCYRDGLVFPPGIQNCSSCGDDLSVICPKCGVARRVAIDTCGNCGLALRLEPRPRALVTSGPKPGGAAAA